MDMRVHEARRENAPLDILRRGGQPHAPGVPGRADGGDPAPRNPNLPSAKDSVRVGGQDPCPGQDEVRGRAAGGDVGEVARDLPEWGDAFTMVHGSLSIGTAVAMP